MLYTPLIWPQLAAVTILIGIALYVRRFRDVPSVRPFSVMVWLTMSWTLVYTFNISIVVLPLKIIVHQLQLLLVIFLSPVIMVLAREYTGRDELHTRKYLAWALVIPVISAILLFTSPYHQLFRYDFRLDLSGFVPVILTAKGPMYWVYVAHAYLLIMISCGLLLISFRSRTVHFGNALVIIVGMLGPFVADLLFQLNLSPIHGFNWLGVAFAVSGVLYSIGLFGLRLFDIVPVARSSVVDAIQDIIIVLDMHEHIVDFNCAAQDQLGLSQKSVGQGLDHLPPAWAELFKRYRAADECKEEITFSPEEAQVFFELTLSSVLDKRGRKLGRLFILHDITQRKLAEQARHESETRYQLLIELMPDGVMMHHNGKVIFANPASARLIGAKSVDELLGKTVLDFVHPDSLAIVLQRIQNVFSENQAVPLIEEKFVRLDGSVIDVEVTSRPIKVEGETFGLTVFHDFSERKRAQERLLQLSRAVEQSPTSIVITNAAGSIEYANPKFTQITGYSQEEALGQNPRILRAGEARPEFYKNLWETITSGRQWHGEFLNRKRNGDLFWEFASISPVMDQSGKITHYVAVKEDITERKQAEADLQQYAGELQARNEELDAFSHTVAHDLKEPIGIIASYTDLIIDQYDDLPAAQAQSLLRKVRQNTDRLTRIIAELMLLAGVRKQVVLIEPLNMAAILEEVLDRLTILTTRNEAQITFQGEGPDPGPKDWPAVLGYAPWVEEIWANYLSNAIHYGGKPPQVEIGAFRQENGKVCFFVRDNGLGLSDSEQKMLFTPFTKLNQVRTKGQGLGLSIVRTIAEKLDGEVGVKSVPGQGSLFYFALPQAAATGEAGGSASQPDGSLASIPDTFPTQPLLPTVSLEGMPAEWLASLQNAARAGDFEQIASLTDAMRGEWPEVAHFVDLLMDRFDYHTIITMIQKATGQTTRDQDLSNGGATNRLNPKSL